MHVEKFETWMSWLLKMIGITLCSAIFPVFMPLSWMQKMHLVLGMGELPAPPIVEYLARSTSAMYFAHGTVVFLASTDVRQYRKLIFLVAGLNTLLGGTLVLIDIWAGMPWWWTTLEGPGILLGAALLWWLLSKTRTIPISPKGSVS